MYGQDIFVWNFKGDLWNSTQNALPIEWKMCILYNTKILKALRFLSVFEMVPSSYSYQENFTHIELRGL